MQVNLASHTIRTTEKIYPWPHLLTNTPSANRTVRVP